MIFWHFHSCHVILQCGSCTAWHKFHRIRGLVNRIIFKKLRVRSWRRLEMDMFPKSLYYKVSKPLWKLPNDFPQCVWNCHSCCLGTQTILLFCFQVLRSLFLFQWHIFPAITAFPFPFHVATVACRTGQNLNLQWFLYLAASSKFL